MRQERGARHFPWTDEQAALLGKLPDAVVAAKVGRHSSAVLAERRRRGIPAARPKRPPIAWTDEMLALLGSDSDPAVAEALGLSVTCVGCK